LNTNEGYNSLLIIDDFQQKVKDLDICKALERIVIETRHLHVTSFYLVQSFQKVPKPIRELAFNLILFNIGKSQKVFEEVISFKKNLYDEIIDLAFQKPHDWALINLHRSKKIYQNWDLIIQL
jgi:hypothetical protein